MKPQSGILGTIIRIKRMHDSGSAITIVPRDGKTAVYAASGLNGYELTQETIDQDPAAVLLRAGLETSVNYGVVPPLKVTASFATREDVTVDVGPGVFALWKAEPRGVVDDMVSDMIGLFDLGYPAWVAAEAELKAGNGIGDEVKSLRSSGIDLDAWISSLEESTHSDIQALGREMRAVWDSRIPTAADDEEPGVATTLH